MHIANYVSLKLAFITEVENNDRKVRDFSTELNPKLFHESS